MYRATHSLIICLISGLMACTVAPPKPYTPQTVDPTAPTYILVGGWLADWKFLGADTSSNGDLREIVEQLKREGSAYIVAPISTKNNQAKNAGIVLQSFRETTGPIIIISGSRGTSEVAQAIAQMTPDEKARIRSWISISGAHLGSGIADYYASPALYWPTALVSRAIGWGPIDNIAEMKLGPSRERFAKIEHHLRGIPTVSIVTVSRDCSHLSGFLKMGCNIVASIGKPHDGLVLAEDQVLPGSKVIRLEGQRHMGNIGRQAEFVHVAQQMVASK